jgi:hypothetical protein
MLEVLSVIIEVDKKTQIDTKWQSDLYCHNYSMESKSKICPQNKQISHKKKMSRLRILSGSSDADSVSERFGQPSDSVVLSYEKEKLGIKKDILDETGFYVFEMESDDFLFKIDKIKDHLKKSNHPLNVFMKKFDDEFWNSYGVYMWKREQLEEIIEQQFLFGVEELWNKAVNDVLNMVFWMLITIVKFYSLDLEEKELKKDLILTFITNKILRSYVYFVLHNLITIKNEERIIKLQNRLKLLEHWKPWHFGANKILSMDPYLRNEKIGPGTKDSTKKSMMLPYFRTIKHLQSLSSVENPVQKLERLYQIYSSLCSKELEIYWKHNKIFSPSELFIDSEALNSIVTYTLIQTQNPKLLIDVLMVEKFTPKSLQYTNRAFYMTALHAAFEHIEEMTEEDLTDLLERINQTKMENDFLFSSLGMIDSSEFVSENFAGYEQWKQRINSIAVPLSREERKSECTPRLKHMDTILSDEILKKSSDEEMDLNFYHSGIKTEFKMFWEKEQNGIEKEEEESSGGVQGLIAFDPYYSSFKQMPTRFSILM